ncbi:hypothetical protein ACFO1B_00125 [Dactylosporangium siamense]|uniref:DUF5666 domain-containing protein n=1 Tax=Dactylosporangium siamense TaxID=685454 RepID=A0A919PFE8_9ACTN|nr:hypothetical protein [Dactylosporangium siamense]GIG42246.1 hypothetical protein Dsi01nite_002870 [Dactylosporangium siamense]
MTEPTPIPPWAASAGPPAPAVRQSRWKLGVVAAVSAVIVVGGGVAVANAATSSTRQPGPGGYGGPSGYGGGRGAGGGPAGFPGGGGARGDLSQALHGDYVVKDSSGKYVTERLQSGTVTAVSATSITAKSEDGHETTFTVDASTKVNGGSSKITDVKTGDAVTVVGLVSGSGSGSGSMAAATSVTDAKLRPTGGAGRPTGTQRPAR